MASKRRTILEYLKNTRLPIITVANGYHTNVGKIQRGLVSEEGLNDSDLPALLLGRTVEKRENITHNQFKSIITLYILGIVKSPDGVSNAQGALDDMIADVTHALETDRLMGGNTKWITIKNITTDDGDIAPRAGFLMEVELAYVTEGITP